MTESLRRERLSIRSDPALIRQARRWLGGLLAELGWSHESACELSLALSEACANAHRYGYAGGRAGRIDLEVELGGQGVRLVVRDYGRGFDPRAYRQPDLGLPQEGGYGIFLMQRLTDRLEFEPIESGTRVVMFKSRTEREADADEAAASLAPHTGACDAT